MTILRIHIDEHWPQAAGAPWALFDERGALLRQGEGEPAQWPPADRCEAVLSAPQATCLRATLPRVPRAEQARAVAYALEDKLVREPDSQHFTVLGKPPGDVAVLVVARDRLKAILGALEAAGRSADRVVSELQTAPGGDGIHLTFCRDAAVLKTDGELAVALDPEAIETEPSLLAALTAGHDRGSESLRVHAESARRPQIQAWCASLGATVGDDYRWYDFGTDAADLRHGEFAARPVDQAWLARLGPALSAAVVLMGVALVVSAAQWAWQKYQLAGRDEEIARLFASAFPKLPVVDPAAQARKQLDLARAAAGQLRSDDALALMADLAEAMGADSVTAPKDLQYEDGRLDVGFAAEAGSALATLEQRLGQRDIAVVRRAGTDGGIRLTLRRGVRR
jgi:type II secretion system protein L